MGSSNDSKEHFTNEVMDIMKSLNYSQVRAEFTGATEILNALIATIDNIII